MRYGVYLVKVKTHQPHNHIQYLPSEITFTRMKVISTPHASSFLLQLEDFRDLVLADLYGISPCTIPPIDTLTDVAFQVSFQSIF